MGRRGATGLAGIVLVDKPAGLTSHDVVARIRRLTGEGRVGHAGTLDPMATGLLVVLVGPYTRLEPYMSTADKAYDATITFGSSTDTEDAEGAVVASAEVPDDVLDHAFAERVIEGFLGPQKQRPPAYSAIKVNGTVAHRAARSGSPIELAERDITVFEARLLGVDAPLHAWNVFFRVSKGTYIRSLARDLGQAVGVPAHLSGLRRTASGPMRIEDAHRLDELIDVEGAFTDPIAALGLPVIPVEETTIANGSPLDGTLAEGLAVETDVAVVCDGILRAIYRVAGDRLVPKVILPPADIS